MNHDPTLAGDLEPGPMTMATERSLPRRKLSPGLVVLLIGLRVYVLIAIPLVIYAFIKSLVSH